MKKYCADFETCVWLEDETFVWAWAVCEIGNEENFIYGNNIDDFIEFCKKEKNAIFYFHNLKFDGEFILYYALTHGFSHVQKKKDIKDNTFTTLISDLGQFYSIELIFKKLTKRYVKATFYDSLKILPFSVEQIAKSFNLSISKLKIDYKKERSRNHVLTQEEIDYIRNDVTIVAKALKVLFDADLTKMTSASNSLADFKKMLGNPQKFYHYFPNLDYEVDKDLRKSYKRRFYVSQSYL